jgi:hypothetical protein
MLQLHRLLLAASQQQQHQQQHVSAHLGHLLHLTLQQQQLCSTPSFGLPQQQHVRAASSKGRGGRKTPGNVKGYDRLLSQWAHMTARPGSSNSSKGKAKRAHGECPQTTSTKTACTPLCRAVACAFVSASPHDPLLCFAVAATAFSSRTPSQQPYGSRSSKRKSSRSDSWYWDADMAQAAAAAQLDPDELHNLVFGRSSNDSSSSSSSSKGSSSRRQQRKAARRRAKSLRKQAASMGWGYDGFGFGWGAAGGSASEGRWGGSAYASSGDSDTDSYSDSEEDDDEYLGGAHTYASPGRFSRQQGRMGAAQQRQWQEWYYQAQPDWQWWTEEQERWVAC